MILPGLSAALLLVGLGGAMKLARAGEGLESSGPAPLCEREHGSRGESCPVDLEALERAYGALRKTVVLRLGEVAVDPERALGRPYDLGLPSCRGRGERRVPLKTPIPTVYRKSALTFVDTKGRPSDPDTEILLVSADNLRRVAELSRELGKRVSLAPPGLVKALGVRCAGTRVTFTEGGDEAILVEGE
jgi:hypothetical protein